jgi:hypothetical protein
MKFAYLRWMIRSSVFWILAGTVLGVVMALGYRLEAFTWALSWKAVHVHMLLVGGVMQMIMGVALWMFPRPTQSGQWPSGKQGWLLYALLNGGTLLRSAIGPMIASPAGFPAGMCGAVAQASAIVYFVVLVLPRIRGVRTL